MSVLGDGDEPLGTGVLGDPGSQGAAAVAVPRTFYLVPFRNNILTLGPRASLEPRARPRLSTMARENYLVPFRQTFEVLE